MSKEDQILADWPFRPHHITNDGPLIYDKFISVEAVKLSEKMVKADEVQSSHTKWMQIEYERIKHLRRLSGEGIISNKYLQGLQTVISANLENPTTIIEFPPNYEEEPVRTDSRLLVFNLHGACRKFREYTDRFCLRCDNIHACLYRSLKRSNIGGKVSERYAKESYICSYREKIDVHFELDTSGSRPYLEYDCPLMGYRELLYPIFFEDKVVASFFVGELCLSKKAKKIQDRQHEYLSNDPEWREWLDQYCQDVEKNKESKTQDKICKEIIDAHDGWVKDKENIFTDEEYDYFKKKVNEQLEELEQTLNEQASLQRGRYVRFHIDQRTQAFREGLPKEEEESSRKWKSLWSNTKSRFIELINNFSIQYVILFAQRQYKKEAPSLDVVVSAGSLPKQLEQSISSNQLCFDLQRISETVRNQWTTSRESSGHPELLSAVQNCPIGLSEKQHLLRLFPVPFYPRAHVAALVGYRDDNLADLPENREGSHLDLALQSFYTVLLHAYSATLADEAEDKMSDALRVFGHEAAQVTSGMAWIWELHLKEPSKVQNISEEKLADVCNDLKSSLHLLSFIFKNARMLLDLPQVRKEKFLAYGEFIYKWKDFNRIQTDYKNCQIDVTSPQSSPQASKARPPMFADPDLVESIFFNLVNNALKYCYEGTKINIDCRLKDPGNPNVSPHKIVITDYGLENEPGDRAFDLHVRGSNVEEEEGLGIGLTLAQIIAKAHRGIIEQQCRKISKYKVPLILDYIERDFPEKDQNLALKLQQEVDRLDAIKCLGLKRILALNEDNERRFKPKDTELVKDICVPTYEVVFTAYIPQ